MYDCVVEYNYIYIMIPVGFVSPLAARAPEIPKGCPKTLLEANYMSQVD